MHTTDLSGLQQLNWLKGLVQAPIPYPTTPKWCPSGSPANIMVHSDTCYINDDSRLEKIKEGQRRRRSIGSLTPTWMWAHCPCTDHRLPWCSRLNKLSKHMNDMINRHARNDRGSDKRACNFIIGLWKPCMLGVIQVAAAAGHNFHGFCQKSCTPSSLRSASISPNHSQCRGRFWAII